MTYETWKQHILKFYKSLYAYAYRLTSNHDEAMDLVQETYYKVYSKYTSFQRGSNSRAWMFRILYHKFCSQYRKNSTAQNRINNYLTNNASQLNQDITNSELIESLVSLDQKYKAISLLYFLEEHTYREIEELTGLKLGTVKSRIYKSRELLKDTIKNKINSRSFLKAV